MEDLINWVELSRYLAGNESSVSRTRCPKKYQKAVDSLIEHLKAWEECEQEQLRLRNVSQEKRNVCPDCGDYGWIYSDDGTSRKTCPCHY